VFGSLSINTSVPSNRNSAGRRMAWLRPFRKSFAVRFTWPPSSGIYHSILQCSPLERSGCELQIHSAAVSFDKAEGVELARGAVIHERAEMTPVHITAIAGRRLDANVSFSPPLTARVPQKRKGRQSRPQTFQKPFRSGREWRVRF